MHSISLFIVGVLLAITICPYTSYATTTESTELEEPKILPLTDAKTSNDDPKLGYSELWQEDDREVLIRNERGAKDNVQGTTTGKKQNKKDKNQMNKNSQKHLNKPDTNLNSDTQNIPNNTPQQQQHQTNVKKHQQKHEKHEKNSKKHASTEKPKPKDENSCRYTKGAWTECDPKTNTRSRTLTLKKGEGSCVPSRTIQKKCRNKPKAEKACRYDKGTWGECQPNGEMTRLDKLKATSDSATCAPTRNMNKKCNKSKQDKQNKQRNSKEKKNDRKKNQ